VRYGGDRHYRNEDPSDDPSDGESPADTDDDGNELFVDAGAAALQVRTDLEKGVPITTSGVQFEPHVAVGARRSVSAKNDLGVRLELDEVDGRSLLGFRPIDYRHRFGDTFALSLYAGAQRYSLATPAYGMYAGIGGQWRNIFPKWDLGLDYRYSQNIARNHVLATDVQGVRPDSFYKIEALVGYISRRF